jgi:hypothetical protein
MPACLPGLKLFVVSVRESEYAHATVIIVLTFCADDVVGGTKSFLDQAKKSLHTKKNLYTAAR